MPFAKLSDLLGRSARKRGISAQVEAAMILEYFKEAVHAVFDSALTGAVRPMHFKDGALTVAVLSPAVAQELKLREREILNVINARAGKDTVRRLRFMS